MKLKVILKVSFATQNINKEIFYPKNTFLDENYYNLPKNVFIKLLKDETEPILRV